jgi:hypothetical protein
MRGSGGPVDLGGGAGPSCCPAPTPLEPAIGSVPPRVEETGSRAPRPTVPSRPASNHEPRRACIPRLGQAKITHLGYALPPPRYYNRDRFKPGAPSTPSEGRRPGFPLGFAPVNPSARHLRMISREGITPACESASSDWVGWGQRRGVFFAAWGRITVVSKGVHDKGKPAARRGRKATGLQLGKRQPGYRKGVPHVYWIAPA